MPREGLLTPTGQRGPRFVELARSLFLDVDGDVRAEILALAVIFLLGAALRLHRLFQPMDFDEAYTVVNFALKSLSDVLSDYSVPNNHIFHSLLVHASIGLFGNAPWAARLPALVAGLALIPATFVLTRKLFGNGWALGAAACVASSEPLVAYSTNARGYTLVALFFVLALVAAGDLIHRATAFGWALFVGSIVLGFYTVPTMLYGVGGLVVWLGIEAAVGKKHRAQSVSFCHLAVAISLAAILTALCYSPVLYRSGALALVGNRFVQPISASSGAFATELWAAALAIWQAWNEAVPVAMGVMIAFGFATSIVAWRRLSPYRFPPAVPLVAIATLAVVVQWVVPFTRVWLFLLPLYFASAWGGLWQIARPLRSRLGGVTVSRLAAFLAVAASLWMASGVMVRTNARYSYPERIDAISTFLRTELRPGDMFAAPGYWATPIAYYFRADGLVSAYYAGTYDTLEIWCLQRELRPELGRWWRQDPPEITRDTRVLALVRSDQDLRELEKIVTDLRERGVDRVAVAARRFGSATVYALNRRASFRSSP
jgi:hypothetical protein